MADLPADKPSDDRVVRRGDREYLVRTYRSGGATIQVALDLTIPDRERDRLFVGLAVAGGAGMLLAGGVGALIARRAIAPLGHAMDRQRRFVADASHELRTPLTQLHTRAQLVELQLRSSSDPARVREDVEQLVRGTRQMGELVGELLLAAQLRIEPRRYGPVDLHDLAVRAAEAERPRAAQRNIAVEVDADDRGPYIVRGAEASIARVLASLVDNALSHTPAGGRIDLDVVTTVPGFVDVRVRDSGEGFDQAESGRLFERFYRGNHGDGRRFGLGLSLVREVVTDHGGTVEAHGAPDAGACFTVRLPAWTAEPPFPVPGG